MKWTSLMGTAVVMVLAVGSFTEAQRPTKVEGAGTTIIAGGTGSPNFVPVTTLLGIHWDGTTGTFDCLALAPSHIAGFASSGIFDTNIMYVDGQITSVTFSGEDVATLAGTANCTGLGAGLGVPFTATVERGGPGARITLHVSGLTFVETLVSGSIKF